MVKIRGLKKSYGSFKVLDGLDMTINKGDVYGFLGKNGCGKTTTMNIICDIIPKDEGEVIIGDGVPADTSPDAPAPEKIKIGYLPETPALFGYMNGYEYLEFIAGCAKYKGDVKKRIGEVLDITGMTEGGRRRIKGYSRGMNQRMGIAATIFNDPDLIILDEPTSALDPQGRAEVINIIKNLTATGATILLCTHILSDVERVANRIGMMKNGKLAIEGSISGILNSRKAASIDVVFPEYPPNAAELFRSSGFAEEVQEIPQAYTIRLGVSDPDEGMFRVMRLLSENRIRTTRVQAAIPTLEDIYIETVGDISAGTKEARQL